jgi:hypothetical protein
MPVVGGDARGPTKPLTLDRVCSWTPRLIPMVAPNGASAPVAVSDSFGLGRARGRPKKVRGTRGSRRALLTPPCNACATSDTRDDPPRFVCSRGERVAKRSHCADVAVEVVVERVLAGLEEHRVARE